MIALPKLAWPREPYRGIEQFRFIDRPVFFERRDETRKLVRLVSIYRGSLLYGESGVGKSSMSNAGFIPAMLDEGFLAERLRVQPVPGAELVVERIALTDEGTAPFLPSRFAADDEQRTRLVFSTADVHARLGLEHEGGAPLLIFDQFEEFVTLFEEAPENRDKFAEAAKAQNALLNFFRDLLGDETLPVKLLFVFREDYLAKLSKLFALVPNLRDQHVRLTFPDSSVLKKLIRGPFESEIPPEHFGHIISEELANKLCAALEERSETGFVNLTEVQIACLSLWRDPKGESLFDTMPDRTAVVQKLLEGHLTGSLDKLSPGLREPAVAILRHLVTGAGTRNIILEADLLERLSASEKISPDLGKRALAELTDQSRLVRRQRRNEAYFYDITSEFLVPWIQRQRQLSESRVALQKFRRRTAVVMAIGLMLGALALIALNHFKNEQRARIAQKAEEESAKKDLALREVNQKDKAIKNLVQAYDQKLNDAALVQPEKVPDAIKNKQEFATEDAYPASTEEGQRPLDSEDSQAVDYVTDKIFVHKGGVWSARYSRVPPGAALLGLTTNFLITASRDQTAGVWDLKGDKDFFLQGHKGEVNDAMFNPNATAENGWFAATAGDDNTAALWRFNEPQKPFLLRGHTAPVTGLAWSGDGHWLVTTSKDKTIRIWNVTASDPSKNPKILTGHTGSVWLPCLVETANTGSWLVTPSGDNTARVWSFPDGKPLPFFMRSKEPGVLSHGAPVRRAAMDSNAQWILTAGAAGHAILWDRITGEKLLTVHHEQPVRDVAFQPGKSLFVTASADKTAEVWDAEKKQGVVTLKGHTAPVFSARFTPYGPGVVTVSWDRTARLWNYETRKCVAILRGHSDALWSVEFSPSGTNFTTTSSDGTARLWELKRIPGGEVFLPPTSPGSAK
jgi:WD40 repeat protein